MFLPGERVFESVRRTLMSSAGVVENNGQFAQESPDMRLGKWGFRKTVPSMQLGVSGQRPHTRQRIQQVRNQARFVLRRDDNRQGSQRTHEYKLPLDQW